MNGIGCPEKYMNY